MTDSTTAAPTHIELLGLVRQVQSAAAVLDATELGEAVERLRKQLELHLAAEQRDHEILSPALKDALRTGQQRLLSLVTELETAPCGDGAKPWLVRTAEVAAMLRHQANLEQRASRLLTGRRRSAQAVRRERGAWSGMVEQPPYVGAQPVSGVRSLTTVVATAGEAGVQ